MHGIQGKVEIFSIVEAVSLIFFVCFLLFRFGNPDLWHPSKGGEKPMDFSYFNAILKAQHFLLMIRGMPVVILIIIIMVL